MKVVLVHPGYIEAVQSRLHPYREHQGCVIAIGTIEHMVAGCAHALIVMAGSPKAIAIPHRDASPGKEQRIDEAVPAYPIAVVVQAIAAYLGGGGFTCSSVSSQSTGPQPAMW